MILIEDTRNKEGKHSNVRRYCEKHGIELVRQALPVGDYMFPDGNISIDTKENLQEVASNLLNRKDSSRFWREVRKARELGLKLFVLIESGPSVLNINQVPKWKSKYSTVTGRRLVDEMIRLEMAYGIVWKFCDKRSTGRVIIEILSGAEKNEQENTFLCGHTGTER